MTEAMTEAPPDTLALNGLDGANPLGFLAALGTLALCERMQLAPRLNWTPYANSYRPRLRLQQSLTSDELAEKIVRVLQEELAEGPPPFCAADLIKRPRAQYRALAEGAAGAAMSSRRHEADFAAAFASDAVCENKSQEVTPTRLSFANGQSGKVLIRDYRDLVQELSSDLMSKALTQPWRYDDDCKTFRWDPRDLRLYALRAENPGSSTTYSSHGGNVLAFWGLTLLPSFPTAGGLRTAGFATLPVDEASRTSGDFFTWPIWQTALSRDAVMSLLLRDELMRALPDREVLGPLGVVAVFRSRRVNYQKSLYFSPAEVV